MNPLNQALDWYNILKSNHKIVVNLLEKDPSSLPPDSPYLTEPLSSVKEQLKRALEEMEDLTVVSLFFLFEKIILSHLEETANYLKAQNMEPFLNQVVKYGLKTPDRWKIEEILDLYKVNIDPNLVGQVKQIFKYRNWIAHGRRGAKPLSIDHRLTYFRLTLFLEQARLI